jgi:hypothetical protein
VGGRKNGLVADKVFSGIIHSIWIIQADFSLGTTPYSKLNDFGFSQRTSCPQLCDWYGGLFKDLTTTDNDKFTNWENSLSWTMKGSSGKSKHDVDGVKFNYNYALKIEKEWKLNEQKSGSVEFWVKGDLREGNSNWVLEMEKGDTDYFKVYISNSNAILKTNSDTYTFSSAFSSAYYDPGIWNMIGFSIGTDIDQSQDNAFMACLFVGKEGASTFFKECKTGVRVSNINNVPTTTELKLYIGKAFNGRCNKVLVHDYFKVPFEFERFIGTRT